ncbi:MAG: cell division protein ZapA [Bacteroidales bacterium]|jgi:cell division protein ZapA|nr:cell division protein ZapA [Bacteroidales bacterium]
MDELSISIPVAERIYRLAIEKEHEELFRKAAKLIDNRIKDYSASYAYKDKQDLLAMVALEYATSFLQNEQLLSENETQWELKLLEMDQILDEQLKD